MSSRRRSCILLDSFSVVESKKGAHGPSEQVKNERLGTNLCVRKPRPVLRFRLAIVLFSLLLSDMKFTIDSDQSR